MGESDRLYTIKKQEKKLLFSESISKEFGKCFAINDDDDDIVLLDESEIIYDEVKNVLNNLINNILNLENHSSQIQNKFNKRLLDMNNKSERLFKKKVRFNNTNEDQQQQLSINLFISEKLQINQQLKPYTQFLYNLGFDLCLEQNLMNNNNNDYSNLTEIDKEILIKQNKIFHQYQIYRCTCCSFQTNVKHVMNSHYQTPHFSRNDRRKYRCIYCPFETYRLPTLRLHSYKKHHFSLTMEPIRQRYQCCFCLYETDEKDRIIKHNKRCEIKQRRTVLDNNLLAPSGNLNVQIKTIEEKNNNNQTTNVLNKNNNEVFEPILIESDHDSSPLSRSTSSDEDFVVSSDEEGTSSIDNKNLNNRNLQTTKSRSRRPIQQLSTKNPKPISSQTNTIIQNTPTLSSLSKLLLLNNASLSTISSSTLNPNKSSLIPIQPKPINKNDVYQMCNICQCYIFKNDYIKHMNDKHNNNNILSSQSPITTPIIVLNNNNNNNNSTNTSITCLKPALVLSKEIPQTSTTIFLLSTSTMNTQFIPLNMIKCPWCDTNFEHIDIMTGHLMKYHRMTLAAAKVVVAEQMKIQGTLSNQLSLMFKKEIEDIQKEFTDKTYWKISQPKVYLHQIENLSCFVCNINMENIENHFFSSHHIELTTMNTVKQCCLCGYLCEKQNTSLFDHQLRTHQGVCYSSTLKQFIRFDPPPSLPISKTIITTTKSNSSKQQQQQEEEQQQRVLTTLTEKKFGCRKCNTSSILFTFEELVKHLRLMHNLNVKLHRRCIICQQPYLKGKEYNQHCLEHLNDEFPSIKIQRQYVTKRK